MMVPHSSLHQKGRIHYHRFQTLLNYSHSSLGNMDQMAVKFLVGLRVVQKMIVSFENTLLSQAETCKYYCTQTHSQNNGLLNEIMGSETMKRQESKVPDTQLLQKVQTSCRSVCYACAEVRSICLLLDLISINLSCQIRYIPSQ